MPCCPAVADEYRLMIFPVAGHCHLTGPVATVGVRCGGLGFAAGAGVGLLELELDVLLAGLLRAGVGLATTVAGLLVAATCLSKRICCPGKMV